MKEKTKELENEASVIFYNKVLSYVIGEKPYVHSIERNYVQERNGCDHHLFRAVFFCEVYLGGGDENTKKLSVCIYEKGAKQKSRNADVNLEFIPSKLLEENSYLYVDGLLIELDIKLVKQTIKYAKLRLGDKNV